MNKRVGRGAGVCAMLGLSLVLSAAGARGQGGPPEESLEGKTASQAYKNIQVLKDIPADQLIPTMQFIAASLGVRCEFCHVEHAFDKDDKEPKRTARKMMQMMLAIDKDNFNGKQAVTCNTCHNGSPHPASIPAIAENEMPPALGARMHGGPPGPENRGGNGAPPQAGRGAMNAPPGPVADHIIGQYVEAIGGAEALAEITSRVEKGTLTAFGNRQFPIEIFAKAPNSRLSVMQLPHGESITAFDGHQGWLSGMGRPARRMSPSDSEAASIDAYFNLAAELKERYQRFFARPPEKVGDQEANVVVAMTRGQPPVKLYFDQKSGLLVRMEHYNRTALGLLPIQIDYGDYREVDGIKIPFRWTLARPGGHFTIQVDSVEQNVPIGDSKFAMPSAPPASASPGGNPPAM